MYVGSGGSSTRVRHVPVSDAALRLNRQNGVCHPLLVDGLTSPTPEQRLRPHRTSEKGGMLIAKDERLR